MQLLVFCTVGLILLFYYFIIHLFISVSPICIVCTVDLDLWTEDPSTVAHLSRYIHAHKLVPSEVQWESDAGVEEQVQTTSSSADAEVSADNVESDEDVQEDVVAETVEQCTAMYNLVVSLIKRKLKS